MAEFRVGDIVQLQSGGPSMTVIKVPDSQAGSYVCAWFDGTTAKEGSYSGAALRMRRSKSERIAKPSHGYREP